MAFLVPFLPEPNNDGATLSRTSTAAAANRAFSSSNVADRVRENAQSDIQAVLPLFRRLDKRLQHGADLVQPSNGRDGLERERRS